jgi:hypothetical protein
MFERLAKVRSVAQWLKAPLGKPVYSHPAYSNDNRPGFRHPEGQDLRPHQALACHWSLAPDGRHLECRWELTAAGGQLAGNRARSPHLPSPPLVPRIGQMTALEQIAS